MNSKETMASNYRSRQDHILYIGQHKSHQFPNLFNLLENSQYKIKIALSGEEGVQAAVRTIPDVILIELTDTEEGFDACRQIKNDAELRAIPVVFFSEFAESNHRMKGFMAGADDFITQPFNPEEALIRIQNQINRQNYQKDIRELNKALQKEIDERKKAEKALAESKEVLDSILASLDGLLVVIDKDHRVIFTNWADHEFIPIEQRRGNPFCYKIFKHLDAPCDYCPPVDTFLDGKFRTYEERNPIDGKFREIRVMPIYVNHRVEYVIEYVQDITPRKQAEELLKISDNNKYTNAFHYSNDAIILLDLEGNVIDVNQKSQSQFAYPKDELMNMNIKDLCLQHYHETAPPDGLDHILKKSFFRFESIFRKKSGRTFHAEISSSLFDLSGEKILQWVIRDITDYKKTLDALTESEHRYRLLVSSLPNMSVLLFDHDMKVILAEGEELKRYSLQTQHIENKKFTETFPTDMVDFFYPLYRKALKGDASILEYTYKGKVYFHQIVPIYDHKGRIYAGMSVSNNITDRKRAEEAFKTILKSTAGAVGQDFFEKTVISLYHWLKCDIVFVGELLPDQTVKTIYAMMNGKQADPFSYALKGTPCEQVTRQGFCLFPKDVAQKFPEDEMLVELNISGYMGIPLIDSTGRPLGIIAALSTKRLDPPDSASDILSIIGARTSAEIERKKVQEALVESKKRFQSIFDYTTVGMCLSGVDGRFLMVNRSLCEILGYTEEELLTMSSGQVIHPEDVELNRKFRRSMIDGSKRPSRIRHRLLHKSGETRWATVGSFLMRKPDGAPEYFITHVQDITKMKILEEQLRQSQKMEAIGTLAGGIAHDFNNILFPIIGYAEMTLDEFQSESIGYQNLKEILKAARRAKNLVNQILTFGRKTPRQMIPVEIQPIIKETLQFLRSTFPVTVELRQDIQRTGVVMADPTQIHQVIVNLCMNAIHALSHAKGIIEIGVHQIDIRPKVIGAGKIAEPGPFVKITVRDTGAGIEESIIEKIFDPYFTTKNIGEGNGLGLAVVDGIVREHNGFITVESEKNNGTAFHVFLPVIGKDAQEIDYLQDFSEHLYIGAETILLVEDEAPIGNMMKQMLESMGYGVTLAYSGAEALEVFSLVPDSFDLVISDTTMPNVTGPELAHELAKIRPHIPIILCTGYHETAFRENINIPSVKEFLQKPISKHQLAKAIRQCLDVPTP